MFAVTKQRLVRALYPYGAVRPIVRGPLRGMRYVVEPGIGFTFSLGLGVFDSLFMRAHVRPGMTVYDIGANRGQMALLLSRLVGEKGRVVSFEPMPELCASIRRNLELNRIRNVRVECMALSDTRGRRMFHFSEAYPTQGKLSGVEPTYAPPGSRAIEVATETLDSMIDSGFPPPDFLKVDVEGAAGAVFSGASATLARVGPPIYLELHGPEEQMAVRDHLIRAGYLIETMAGEIVDDPVSRWASPLFCRRVQTQKPQ